MEFSEFVNYYYNKKRRSGMLWEPATVAEDAGIPLDQAQAWWRWCVEEGLSDAELVSRWETDGLIAVNALNMGTIWVRRKSGDPDRLVSSLTVRELEAMFARFLKPPQP